MVYEFTNSTKKREHPQGELAINKPSNNKFFVILIDNYISKLENKIQFNFKNIAKVKAVKYFY